NREGVDPPRQIAARVGYDRGRPGRPRRPPRGGAALRGSAPELRSGLRPCPSPPLDRGDPGTPGALPGGDHLSGAGAHRPATPDRGPGRPRGLSPPTRLVPEQ